jgi:hypothetical protein
MMLKRRLKKWVQKTSLVVFLTLFPALNYSQVFVSETTSVDSGNYVLTEDEFNKLLFTLEKDILKQEDCDAEIALQDSIIVVQDSTITIYKKLADKQWVENLLYTIAGYLTTLVIK